MTRQRRRPDEAEFTCDMMMPVWIVLRHGLHYAVLAQQACERCADLIA